MTIQKIGTNAILKRNLKNAAFI